MNYQAGLDTAEARIYRAAGIPEPLWKLNDANLASASAASPAYMNLTIWPRLSTLAEILTEYVVSRFDPTGTMFLAFDNPDNEDVTQETARMVSLANAGLVSANEARAALGIEQAGPELDVYRFNGVPIMLPAMDRVPEEADDEATEAPEERDEQEDPAPETGNEPKGGNGDGADDAGEGDEATAAKSNDLRSDGTGGNALARHGDGLPGRGSAALSKLTCTCDNHTKEAELAKRPDGMNAAIEQMADDMARWYQATLAAGITESGLVVSTQALSELDRVLDDGLARMYRQGYADTIQAQPDADGVMPTFDINDRARQYLMETKLELVRTIPETLKDEATRIIADGVGQGQTINEIRDGLGDVGSADAMAERVARTETARAYQYGDMQGAEELGGFKGRTWLLAGGPCPLCAAASEILAGKVVPFSEPFFKAGTTIAAADGAVTLARDVFVPSELHPNCRCISINELADEEGT
jgi:hypothetical protein